MIYLGCVLKVSWNFCSERIQILEIFTFKKISINHHTISFMSWNYCTERIQILELITFKEISINLYTILHKSYLNIGYQNGKSWKFDISVQGTFPAQINLCPSYIVFYLFFSVPWGSARKLRKWCPHLLIARELRALTAWEDTQLPSTYHSKLVMVNIL